MVNIVDNTALQGWIQLGRRGVGTGTGSPLPHHFHFHHERAHLGIKACESI